MTAHPSSSTVPQDTHDTLVDENESQPADLDKIDNASDKAPLDTTGATNSCQADQVDTQQTTQDRAGDAPPQEYLVKTIDWFDHEKQNTQAVRIITQNENGPCPLVAICNVLFLRGDLEIRPPDRESVSFEYLVDRLGDYLLTHEPKSSVSPIVSSPLSTSPPAKDENQGPTDIPQHIQRQPTAENVLTYRYNLDAALSIIPKLQNGLDVNVQFTSIRGFETTAELAMFDLFGVDLVHGWIADPQDEETYRVVASKCESYNAVVECVVNGDSLCQGAIVDDAGTQPTMPPGNGSTTEWTESEQERIRDGLIASDFLRDTATQLTYYGLELLTETLPSNSLCVLFRNNHFSTLFKHPKTQTLFTLVTDSSLASNNMIVWESLSDIDQGSSEFFDAKFAKAQIRTEPALPQDWNPDTELDYAIALSLQHQEDQHTRQQSQAQERTQAHHRVPAQQVSHGAIAPSGHSGRIGKQSPANKKKEPCIIS